MLYEVITVHAKSCAFLNYLNLFWTKQDQTLDWVDQEKHTFLGLLGGITRDKALLAHLSVGGVLGFDHNGRHIGKCQLCTYPNTISTC